MATRLITEITSPFSIATALTLHEERSFQGVWSKPEVPLLVFADHALPASAVTFHGGAIGTGLPVQLIFWGAWWKSAEGAARAALITDRTRAVIDSNYFSELAQYGIARPTWRGALTVLEPGAPGAFNDTKDSLAVPNLIDDLIDDDVFPDPDDGRIAFVVLMPKGFTQTLGANGAHTYDYDYEFPFDTDNFWVSWVRYFDPALAGDNNPESTIRTVTHELVELFTDPEPESGWNAGVEGEIGDAASSGGTKQSAWVNGAQVSAYWSNRHGATVIPIDRDYAARLKGVTSEEARRIIRRGTFRPPPSDSAACGRVPQCCFEDRDYTWTLLGFDEVARVRLVTVRYRQPKTAWQIEGVAVSGLGSLSFNLLTEVFPDRFPLGQRKLVRVDFNATDDLLEIRVAGSECNFDLKVSCAVRDASITGNLKTDVIAVPAVVVGFVGAQIELDPAYAQQRTLCWTALTAKYKLQFDRLSKVPGPGDPIDQAALTRLPAYARLERYQQTRTAITLSRMAQALLPAEAARTFAKALVEEMPAVPFAAQDAESLQDLPASSSSCETPDALL